MFCAKIKPPRELRWISGTRLRQRSTKCFRTPLAAPSIFEQFFKDKYDLLEIVEHFPKHADVLGQESVNDAVRVIEQKLKNADLKEVKKNSRLLGVLRRREDSLFSEIPEEIANKIVNDTRDSKYLRDKDASDIFESEYKNQPTKK